MFKQTGAIISAYTKFFITSFVVISLPLLLLFMSNTPEANHWLGHVYRLSIPLYYFFIFLGISLLLLPLYRVKYLFYLILVPKILLDIFLLADYFVFKIYRFHIDMMFVNMAISDYKGIGLSPLMSFVSVLAVLAIVGINRWLYKSLKFRIQFKIKTLILLLFLWFAFGQLVHIWANYYKQQFIEQYTPYFPYYFPTTSYSLMKKNLEKHPGWIPKPIEKAHQNLDLLDKKKGNSLLNYPIAPLQFSDSLTNKPNILFVVLESWRSDFLSADVMPTMDSLSRQSFRFNNHYSGGNVTVSGIFSLMYGLHPTYLSYVQADAYKNQTVLTKSLATLEYDIKAYTSSNLDRFSLKAMLFNHIDDNHYINVLKGRADRADRKVIDKLVADIQSEQKAPWFKFVFLTSSHHHYNYPDEYIINTPLPDNSEGFIFDKDIDAQPFINDYQNALRYEDALFSNVLEALIKSGKYDNTLIIITGDHAEEFNDNKQAYWGHGSNFTKYQTSVPLIVRAPYQNISKVIRRRTAHIDIVPTILNDYLGCKNPLSDYASGKSLLDSLPQSSFIMTSYKDKAYLIDEQVYATGLFVKSYSVGNIKQENKNYNYKALNDLRKEENHFLRK
jgi:membrane-anchored protein YejM (alkaline phosphatase superfamily)